MGLRSTVIFQTFAPMVSLLVVFSCIVLYCLSYRNNTTTSTYLPYHKCVMLVLEVHIRYATHLHMLSS